MLGQLAKGDHDAVNFYDMRNRKTGNSLGVDAFVVCFDLTSATEGELKEIAHDLLAVDPNKIKDPDARNMVIVTKEPWKEMGEEGDMAEPKYDPRIMAIVEEYWEPYALKYAQKRQSEWTDAGLKQGELKEKERMARKMLIRGRPYEEIMEFTELPRDRIEELRASMTS